MRKLKKYWHLLAAFVCIAVMFVSENEAVTATAVFLYRGFIAYGLILAGLKGLAKDKTKLANRFGRVLIAMAVFLVGFTLYQALTNEVSDTLDWVWLAMRAIIDPIYYGKVLKDSIEDRKESRASESSEKADCKNCDTCEKAQAGECPAAVFPPDIKNWR